MDKIARGVAYFQHEVYPKMESLFKDLSKGQSPRALFITCSDSRVDPSLITQTQPGEMFLIHNAGNIVPPHGAASGGISASIEYAVEVLRVKHIIVCGHSGCGAMGGLLKLDQLERLTQVRRWLSFAEITLAKVNALGQDLPDAEKIEALVHMNIPAQLNHLKTIPCVAARLISGEISLHGWVYHIETAKIDVFDPLTNEFIDFEEAYPTANAIS